MNVWWLAFKDLLLLGKDRKALLTLVLMPLLLIGILGSAFGNLFAQEEAKLDKFTLGIVNGDEGVLGKTLEQDVFAKGLPDLIKVLPANRDSLYQMLKDQEIEVGLIIERNFSKAVMAGEQADVRVISIPAAGIPSMVTENVIQQFSREAALKVTGMKLAIEAAAKSGKQPDLETAEKTLNKNMEAFELIKKVPAEKDGKTVGSFQYYAAGMGVMFLLMTVVNGVSAMIEEKEQEVYKRLMVSRLTYGNYLAGKFIGLLFLSIIQMLIIILGTSVIFDVDWGNSISGIILIAFSFVFSTCGLGVMVGSLVKTGKAFEIAGLLGTQIMAAVGGSMVPLYVFPDWLNNIVRIFPNALALQSFLDLMSGEGAGSVAARAAALFGLGLLFLGVGWLRMASERRAKYA